MINTRTNVEAGETPEQITVSMIDQDLKDGISKAEMAIKYSIKPWEVDEMFKHPFLKGRRPSRKKALSFSFVDDITEDRIKETGTVIDREEPDPNQVTLEQAIDDAIETVEQVKTELKDTEAAVLDILSPTEYETPEETLLKAASDTNEDEIEMDDNTFEL
tara:strand:- start:68 stop:550 length:483 start_codon:yes stop_codon:yes gene_type:complete